MRLARRSRGLSLLGLQFLAFRFRGLGSKLQSRYLSPVKDGCVPVPTAGRQPFSPAIWFTTGHVKTYGPPVVGSEDDPVHQRSLPPKKWSIRSHSGRSGASLVGSDEGTVLPWSDLPKKRFAHSLSSSRGPPLAVSVLLNAVRPTTVWMDVLCPE